jgi:hypothetical protein
MTQTAVNRRTLAALTASLAMALAGAGCGAGSPQAPFAQAKKLDAATSDIATDCGLTYQVTAFRGEHHAEVVGLDRSAASSARTLASVYRRNPAWIYQGETVAKIVHDGVAMLGACGLRGAASVLSAAASGRASRTAP